RGFRRGRVDRGNEDAERPLVLVPKPPVVGEGDVRHQQHERDAEQHCRPPARFHGRPPPVKGSWIESPGARAVVAPPETQRLRSPATATSGGTSRRGKVSGFAASHL